MKPCLLGADEIEIGASPTPKIDSSTNWPEEKSNASRASSSMRRSSKSFSCGVRSMIEVMRAGQGRYGLTRDARAEGLGDHRSTSPVWSAATTFIGLMPALHARAQRPQPTHSTRSNLDR